GLPLASGLVRKDSFAVAVYDGDTPLTAQTDNHSIDLAGDVRWCMLTVLVPVLMPAETKRLKIRLAEPGATTPGLSAEAIAAAIPDCVVEISNLLPGPSRGVLRASMAAGLAAPRAWDPVRPCLHGAWRRGPVCTE